MILHTRSKPPGRILLARHGSPPTFFDRATGELTADLDRVLLADTLIVFDNLPNALEGLALELAERGTLEIYGDGLAAAWLRKGRKGVRFAGLQGYGLELATFRAMAEFWQFLEELCSSAGTFPANTPGATALRLVESLSPESLQAPSPRVQAFGDAAYSAGARHAKGGRYKQAFLYDIHAAYPHAMREPLPWGLYILGRESDFFITRLTFDYDSHIEFSPLWVRDMSGKVYHPHKARGLTLTLNSIDLDTLARFGRLRITRRYETLGAELAPALEPVQAFLDDWQAESPRYRPAVKILRNAIYGKLAQRGEQYHYTLKGIDNPRQALQAGNLYREYNGFQFGLFRRPVQWQAFTHLPVAGAITALVRARLYAGVNADTLAVRTDSILSRAPRPDLPQGDGEGLWALQGSGRAIVLGESGFILGREPHLDGVQWIDPQALTAGAIVKDTWGLDGGRERRQWRLQIEPALTVQARGRELTLAPLGERRAIAPARPL